VTSSFTIGFNLYYCNDGRAGGVYYFALSLLREIIKTGSRNLLVFSGPSQGPELRNLLEPGGLKAVQIDLPEEIFQWRDRFDVLFTPGPWEGVIVSDRPTVAFIPDVLEHFHPEFFTQRDLDMRLVRHGHSARACTLLVTPSQFSKTAIVERYGISGEKVRVVPHGVHPLFSDPSQPGSRPVNLPSEVSNYLFFPSNSWKHKNHLRLLEALVKLRDEKNLHVPCVFTGELLTGESNFVDILGAVRDRGLSGQVFHLGKRSVSELKYLYSNALALVHPSLCEGFGLPIVEAMACGCPIVAAGTTSIPEVAGDAAIYFDPLSVEDMVERIAEAAASPERLSQRSRLGRQRAALFSDELQAQAYLDIWDEVYNSAEHCPLKTRSDTGAVYRASPLVSVVLVLDGNYVISVLDFLEPLMKHFGSAIEVFCCYRETDGIAVGSGLKGMTTIPYGVSLHEAFRKIAESASGEWLFFSDGKSVILESFIRHLEQGRSEDMRPVELLFGDCYFRFAGSASVESTTTIVGLSAEDMASYYAGNFAFVVVRQAFERTIEQSAPDFTFLGRLCRQLWETCTRERVYKPVSLRMEWDRFYGKHLSESLQTRFASRPTIRRMLESRFGSLVLLTIIELYSRMPVRIRKVPARIFRVFLRTRH
jgi:glycosyltransferase involved in cell wall biosynthesis